MTTEERNGAAHGASFSAGDSPSVPVIEPVSDAVARPLWSVMIPTYNCARFLRETLASILAQDPGADKMQIEVVDDVSTSDNPKAVVDEIGKGRVSFFRQPKNLGPTGNFNTCLQRSRGLLVHILHGDDYVLPGFYRVVGEKAAQRPDLAFFHVRTLIVDETGELDIVSPRTHALEEGGADAGSLYYVNPLCTPGAVVRRKYYESNGGFDQDLVHVADWEMWVRAITLGGGITINSLLAAYRCFPSNHSSQLRRTGGNLRDWLRLAESWAKRGMPGFTIEVFRAQVANHALSQAEHYRRAHDEQAAALNMELWSQLATKRMQVRRWAKQIGRHFLG